MSLHTFCNTTLLLPAISKQFLSRTNWKILHLTDFFTHPAVVMVLTTIRCVIISSFEHHLACISPQQPERWKCNTSPDPLDLSWKSLCSSYPRPGYGRTSNLFSCARRSTSANQMKKKNNYSMSKFWLKILSPYFGGKLPFARRLPVFTSYLPFAALYCRLLVSVSWSPVSKLKYDKCWALIKL